jgi:hypothetical protein
MFDIYLTDEVVREPNPAVPAVYGKIQLGAYVETFVASLVFWTPSQYEQHWHLAAKRMVEGAEKSALITSYIEPTLQPDEFLIWWLLYRDLDTVFVQNQFLFFERLRAPFSTSNPWDSIPNRRTVNDEGMKISEWTTTVDSFADFLGRRP